MEDESGFELRLGLSLGGSKPSPKRNPDATPNSNPNRNPNPKPNRNPNPKPDEGSSTQIRSKQVAGEGGSNSILIDLTKSSHLSINTGDGSVGENDDMAESHETEGSNYNSDNKGGPSASGVSINRFSGRVPVSFQASNHVMMPSGGGVLMPAHQMIPIGSGGVMPPQQMLPGGGGGVMPAQQMVFGYSSRQIPTLETSTAWAYTHLGSKGKFLAKDDERKSYAPVPIMDYHKSIQETIKKNQALLATVPQNQQPNTTKPNPNPNRNPNPNPNPNHSRNPIPNRNPNPIPNRHPNPNPNTIPNPMINPNPVPNPYPIRRGLSQNIKFGGTGSRPDLPWVTTTGPGPGGKTISGVTYRHSGNMLRIVCACHGTHMSPEEFIKHAT